MAREIEEWREQLGLPQPGQEVDSDSDPEEEDVPQVDDEDEEEAD